MSTTVSPPPAQYTTTAAPAGSDGPTKSWLPEMSVSIIVLIVLASLCAVLGAIYAYIYYTRINPRSARAKRFIERGQSQDAEDPEKATHTHLLLFRKK